MPQGNAPVLLPHAVRRAKAWLPAARACRARGASRDAGIAAARQRLAGTSTSATASAATALPSPTGPSPSLLLA